MRTRGLATALVIGVLGLATSGCQRTRVVHDLVAAFPGAERRAEPGLIDLGAAEARDRLIEGWSFDEVGLQPTTSYVWSDGPRSIVDFLLPASRDLTIELRGAPFAPGPPQAQVVTLALNGDSAELALLPGLREYEVSFPASATRSGVNRLELRYSWMRRPCDLSDSADRRDLAVAWDYIRFVAPTPEAELGPRHDAVRRSLFIPWGATVHYYANVPEGAALSIGRLQTSGKGRLEVELDKDTVGTRSVPLRLSRWNRGAFCVLPSGGIGRLTLKATGSRPGEPGGVTLQAPAVVAAAGGASGRGAAPRRPASVLIYLVDALRLDRLGCYGYDRPVSPRIDGFAQDAIVFENAVAESSWTRPAVASVLTGLPPRIHGSNGRDDLLPGAAVTLAEILSDRGYETAGFTTNGNVAGEFGFGQGFDTYELLPGSIRDGPTESPTTAGGEEPSSPRVHGRIASWLSGRSSRRPFFLYAHPTDPHSPYYPPEVFRRQFAPNEEDETIGSVQTMLALANGRLRVDDRLVRRLEALYDAEVAAADEGFGRVLDLLRARGLYDDMLILLVADHGEEFFDHGGWEHGRSLHAEVVRVPFVLKLPGRSHAGRRAHGMVQLADILPTILDAIGQDVGSDARGRNILSDTGEPLPPWSGSAQSFLDLDGARLASIQEGGFKLIRGRRGDKAILELYETITDPGERTDLLATHPIVARYLESRLDAAASERRLVAAETPAHVGPEVLENLRALGYVH